MRTRSVVLTLLILLAGCARSTASSEISLTVFAASSLGQAFPLIAPDATFQFAGSDDLTLQIREGAPADVFAGASPSYAAELFEAGLAEPPRAFATNRMALIAPRDNPAQIKTLDDLGDPGVRIVIGAPGVPAGDYARALLVRAGAEQALDRVVSEEESAQGILGKIALGEADAGFVYETDVVAARGSVIAIPLPAEIQPNIQYTLAVVTGSRHRAAAQRFVETVTGPAGRRILQEAGFGLP
ncbi:MAG TPA: molybdate ABC transporter substrate-binding protein [Actinomycetota bacterium]|nr:molybdate ABC transporter substrate-binding protein [Actinomycetota bacterium]